MKRYSVSLVIGLLLLASSPLIANAAVKTGAACTKLGMVSVVQGKAYTCVKSGKKNVWSKGVVAKTPAAASKKQQSINVGQLLDREISELYFSVLPTASSGLLVQVNSLTPLVCNVSLLFVITLESSGTCLLNFLQSGDSNFSSANPVNISFNVLKIKQTIEPDDSVKKLFLTEETQKIYWFADSGLEVSLNSLTPTVCTIAFKIVTLLAIGDCEIHGSQAGNDKYHAAAPVTFKYEIVKAVQEIDFYRIQDSRLDEVYIELEAYSDVDDENFVPIFSTTTPENCVIEDNRVILRQVGSCTVHATHPGNNFYAPAPIVSQTFNILPSRLGSFLTPAPPGVAFSSNNDEITFIEYDELDMFSICEEDYYYVGCMEDPDSEGVGIPDPDSDVKIVALLFDYKNISNTTSNVYLNFNLVYNNEIFELNHFSYLPNGLRGKKLLPNAQARGYVYIAVQKSLRLSRTILLFEKFDKDYEDVYVKLTK